MARQQQADSYEQELAEYLQKRIKPNLNSGAIPLLARSIAKDLASRRRPDEEAADDDESQEENDMDKERVAEADEEFEDEVEEEPEAEADEEFDQEPEDEEEPEGEDEEESEGDDDISAFEEEMHELQEELGDEWVVRFSVKNDEAWLTAEKEDGSQHVEAPTADVLREAVELLEEGGGRSD